MDADNAPALGHGKIRLLEQIEQTGSISAAGRALGMSYRRTWLLVDSVNRLFAEPSLCAPPGGGRGAPPEGGWAIGVEGAGRGRAGGAAPAAGGQSRDGCRPV